MDGRDKRKGEKKKRGGSFLFHEQRSQSLPRKRKGNGGKGSGEKKSGGPHLGKGPLQMVGGKEVYGKKMKKRQLKSESTMGKEWDLGGEK